MARRKQGGIDTLASMPWWIGIALGLLGYVALRHGIAWYLDATGDPHLSGLGKFAASDGMVPLAWMLLTGCCVGALVSFVGCAHRRKLLDNQIGIDSLRRMSWRQFEQLAGKAFRRQGYVIEETGLGGADGGIDLILRKNGQTTLVQCKQWQNRQVEVKVVRELYGLQIHHQAAAVKIVVLGDYTPGARRFAQGKFIELIHGGELIATVRKPQTGKARATHPLDTPLALGGSIAASLLLITGLSPSIASTSQARPIAVPPTALQSTLRPGHRRSHIAQRHRHRAPSQ